MLLQITAHASYRGECSYQALWTGATNLSLLPVVFLTYRVDMRFESIVCFLAVWQLL